MHIHFARTTMAVLVSLSFSAFTSAKADEMSTTSTTTTTTDELPVGTVTTDTSRTTTLPGGVVYFRNASPVVLVTTLEKRRTNLEKSIDEARDRGEITDEKCRAMKHELKRISNEGNPNTISYSRAVIYAQDLDLIGAQYRSFVSTAPAIVPIINGSHFTVYNGQVLQLDDLSVRRADLEGRVIKDYFQGRLTAEQSDNLRAQLDSIGNEQAAYTADGNLNNKNSRHLYNEFDRVASEIEKKAGKDNN